MGRPCGAARDVYAAVCREQRAQDHRVGGNCGALGARCVVGGRNAPGGGGEWATHWVFNFFLEGSIEPPKTGGLGDLGKGLN